MPEPLNDDELAFLHSMVDLARDGGTAELADAVERGVPVNLTTSSGDTLLILATYHGHPETVRMLLDHGADVERVNARGQTALGAAVFRQSAVMTTMLLAAGAHPGGGGRTPLEIAEFFDLPEMAALLHGHRAG